MGDFTDHTDAEALAPFKGSRLRFDFKRDRRGEAFRLLILSMVSKKLLITSLSTALRSGLLKQRLDQAVSSCDTPVASNRPFEIVAVDS
jgi:hypothetical protein